MSEQTALAMATEHPSAAYLDVATAASNLTALKMRHNLLVGAMKDVLAEGVDYGKIPGTGDKPTLLKAGAENLSFLFGLRPTFELIDSIEDWDRGLFYYRYRCTLHDGAGRLVANSEGSCNSRETKYRYRNEDRKCPRCGKATIIKGREQYGGGWLCYAKKGGCGAKFPDGDPVIEGQATGKVENTEPFELVNTLQKMAQKRALVAAVLVGTGASQFFTQDVEDMTIITVDAVPVTPKSEPEPKRAAKPKPAEESEEVAAMLGVASDEDDDASASDHKPQAKPQPKPAAAQSQDAPDEPPDAWDEEAQDEAPAFVADTVKVLQTKAGKPYLMFTAGDEAASWFKGRDELLQAAPWIAQSVTKDQLATGQHPLKIRVIYEQNGQYRNAVAFAQA